MKNLPFLGAYALSGVLLLCSPLIESDLISYSISVQKMFWIQLIAFFLSIISLLSIIFKDGILSYSWNWIDTLPLAFFIWILLSYNYTIDSEPEKLLFIGQVVVIWYFLRYITCRFPLLNNYYLYIFISIGLIEAIWGFRQLHGWEYSNHSLYRLTGSFFNPGPYSGYLAVTIPVAFAIFLKQIKKNIIYYLSAVCLFSMIVVLPAGMSRSAWIATIVSCLWVYTMYRIDRSEIKLKTKLHKGFCIIAGIFGLILLIGCGSLMYTLKQDSADGRLLMWKITTKAICKQPIKGTGIGGFPAAYAKEQAEYMASGKATTHEKWIAGCPEYAFNEYLQTGLELGVIGLALFTAWLLLVIYKGIKNKRYDCCGGLISLAIFAFSSYPLQLPDFWMVMVFLGTISITAENNRITENFTKSKHYVWQKELILVGVAFLGMGLFWKQKDYYNAYIKWDKAEMLFRNRAYHTALEIYEPLYPLLMHNPKYLFEAAQCLNKTEQYEKANEYLERAILLSSDPMLYYVMAKNKQAMEKYNEAEEDLLYALSILPERIYPYYLLTKLYAEPKFYNEKKLRAAKDSVLKKGLKYLIQL